MSRLCLAAGLLSLISFAACNRSATEAVAEPPVEEVGAALDAELSLEGEEKARRRGPVVSGVMPEDFPAALPVYAPSSLIDYGDAPGGRFVALVSPDPLARVGSGWRAELVRAGWAVSGAGGDWVLRRGGRQARAVLTEARPGTEIRIEYRPAG